MTIDQQTIPRTHPTLSIAHSFIDACGGDNRLTRKPFNEKTFSVFDSPQSLSRQSIEEHLSDQSLSSLFPSLSLALSLSSSLCWSFSHSANPMPFSYSRRFVRNAGVVEMEPAIKVSAAEVSAALARNFIETFSRWQYEHLFSMN